MEGGVQGGEGGGEVCNLKHFISFQDQVLVSF